MTERLTTWGLILKSVREGKTPLLTQQQLADKIGVSQATVARWETGKAGPSDTHKIALAKALDTDVRVLFPLFAEAS